MEKEMKETTNIILPRHSFKHKWQLRQLERLDKPAYAKIATLLHHSQYKKATEIIKVAMHNILTRLTPPPPSFNNITQIIENKPLWYSGEVKDLWISGSSSLHIRNESGCLNALFITEGKTLMDRKTETLQVGYLDPKQGQWKIIPSTQNSYNKIIAKGEI